jgi:hypothetical protein
VKKAGEISLIQAWLKMHQADARIEVGRLVTDETREMLTTMVDSDEDECWLTYRMLHELLKAYDASHVSTIRELFWLLVRFCNDVSDSKRSARMWNLLSVIEDVAWLQWLHSHGRPEEWLHSVNVLFRYQLLHDVSEYRDNEIVRLILMAKQTAKQYAPQSAERVSVVAKIAICKQYLGFYHPRLSECVKLDVDSIQE